MPALSNPVLLSTLLAVALLAYWPSTMALWDFWQRDPFVGGHGLLIALISIGLLARAHNALTAARRRPSVWGAVGLLVLSLAWLICWRASLRELHMLLLPLLLILVVLAVFGADIVRLAAFPLAYLYFAEQPWDVLIGPLQALTVRAVGLIAPLLGMPVKVTGTQLSLPHDLTFEVTRYCSGLNFLVVGLAIAALLGELQQAALGRRALLLALMAAVTVVTNCARVLLIIAGRYFGGLQQALVTSGHVLFGWVLFALVMLGFALVAVRRPAPSRS